MTIANKEGLTCGTEGHENVEEVGNITRVSTEVEAVQSGGSSQSQAYEIMKGEKTPCAESPRYSSTASRAVPVNRFDEAACLASVSGILGLHEKQRGGHQDTQQVNETLCHGSLRSCTNPWHSAACSVPTTHREKERAMENAGPLPTSAHPCVEKKISDCTLDADQYALYAACYQWYYHVMQNAKQKAAQATALTQQKTDAEPTLPDSKRELVFKWLERPARQQVDDQELRRYSHTEGGTEFNIWYGKYLTDRYANKTYRDRETAPYKCFPERDAGYTLADTNTPSTDNYFCIYFARGACALGRNCRYRHSLPTLDDEAHLEWSHDIFGRERFKCHRDDMDGVGSFNSDCKTLFVCGFRVEPGEPDALRHVEELLRKEFGVWGDIEDVRVIPKKHIAFISYAYRVQAEFAKAAMADQNLGPRAPLLVVKWAFHNPRAERKRKCHHEEESQQSHTLKQATPADIKEGADQVVASGDCPGCVNDVAAHFHRLEKCRRAGSDETIAVLSELLQKQCDNWEHQLKTFQELREKKVKSPCSATSSPHAGEGWAIASTHTEAGAAAKWGATYSYVAEEKVPPLAAPPSTSNRQTLSGPVTETLSPEEIYEEQALVTGACSRIQEILGTVESLDPSAFEVHI